MQADFALDLGKVKRIVVPNQPNAVRPGVLSTEPAPVPTTRKNLTEVGHALVRQSADALTDNSGFHLPNTVFLEAAMKLSSRITTLRFSLTWMLLTGLAWSAGITVSPKHAAVVVSSQTQQFTCSVANVTWSVDGVAGGNASVGTISASGLYMPPALAGVHVVKATTVAAPQFSGTATVAVTDLAGVFTYHNDKARDGVNSREFALMPATVTAETFGKLFSCPVDRGYLVVGVMGVLQQ